MIFQKYSDLLHFSSQLPEKHRSYSWHWFEISVDVSTQFHLNQWKMEGFDFAEQIRWSRDDHDFPSICDLRAGWSKSKRVRKAVVQKVRFSDRSRILYSRGQTWFENQLFCGWFEEEGTDFFEVMPILYILNNQSMCLFRILLINHKFDNSFFKE